MMEPQSILLLALAVREDGLLLGCPALGAHGLHGLEGVVALHHLAEHHVAAVEPVEKRDMTSLLLCEMRHQENLKEVNVVFFTEGIFNTKKWNEC